MATSTLSQADIEAATELLGRRPNVPGMICPAHNLVMYRDIDPFGLEIRGEAVEIVACEECFQELKDAI